MDHLEPKKWHNTWEAAATTRGVNQACARFSGGVSANQRSAIRLTHYTESVKMETNPIDRFKLNFDASIFLDRGTSRVGAILRNDRGAVMAALLAKGPPVMGSEEAEIFACCRAVEFAVECGFLELVLEGDNQALMDALNKRKGLSSWLGRILQDVLCMLDRLRWVQVVFVKRSTNSVAHVLARYAKDLVEDIVWIEDSSPPVVEALYFDSVFVE